MKKILFTVWTTSLGGGAEKVLSTITKELSKNYEIDVLEVGKFGNHKIELGDNVKLLKPVVNKIDDSRIVYLFKRFLLEYCPNFVKRIRCKKNYDYEIAFNYLYPAYLIDKKAKSIAWNHGSIENLLEQSEYKNKIKYGKVLNNFNKIVAISNKTKESIVAVYPEYENKIELIYNGYNFNEIVVKSEELTQIDFEADSLMFLGRLEKAKGVFELVNLYLCLFNRGFRKKLYLFGEGEEKENLQKFINDNNLGEYVILAGYSKNPYPYIKKSSYIIMLSYAEGFPTVFVEGLSLGVGFISTEVGGTCELSNNGLCGFISNDFNELENYIFTELAKDKEDRIIIKNNCLEYIKNYSLETQIKKIKTLLKELDNE